MAPTGIHRKPRRRSRFAVLCCAPLMAMFAGCPAISPRHVVVDGMMSGMHRDSEEATYQRMRSDLETTEGRPIVQ